MEAITVNHMYVLLRLDTSPNPLNDDSNIDRHEAKVFLSYRGARAVMKAEYDANVDESDRDHFCEDDEALIITDEGEVRQWKIQLVGVTP